MPENLHKIKKFISSRRGRVFVLVFLMAIGAFLRSYRLRDWLYFYPDQARDLMIVMDYLNGESKLPLLGFKAASTDFQLGAMYSYFQIISAKIFGAKPEVVAYPDVLFGILSIPLLYHFLKKYFSKNISLALTGLYSISFYAVRYSRFAWNSNPIPFFTLLFLSALSEFLNEKDSVAWKWVTLLGVSLGVGIQLHTVLLILMPMTALGIMAYCFWRGGLKTWKKWLAVFLLAIVLNAGQLIGEFEGNFRNTRAFFRVFNDRSTGKDGGIAENFILNAICASQASFQYLSSFENKDECHSFAYLKNGPDIGLSFSRHLISLASLSAGFSLVVFGCLLLWKNWLEEKERKKKTFLGLSFAYGSLAFLIMLPIIGHNGQVRYWLPVFFLPFVFLGFVGKYFLKMAPKGRHWLIGVCFLILVGLNIVTISGEVRKLLAGTRSNARYVVLGELDKIGQYIISDSQSQKEAYIFGGQKYMQNYYKQLFYLGSLQGFKLARGGRHPENIPLETPIYFIDQNPDELENINYLTLPEYLGFKVLYRKDFKRVAVYRVLFIKR